MIINLSQVKSLLNISGTAKDTLISAMIPEAEAKYLQIRNIPFLQIQGDLTTGDKTITDIRVYPYTLETQLMNGVGITSLFLNLLSAYYSPTFSSINSKCLSIMLGFLIGGTIV